MKRLPSSLLILYADLLQQMQSATDAVGSIRIQRIKGIEYLKANATVGIQRRTIYIGPAKDPGAQIRALAIQDEMQRAKARRQTIRLLRNGGVPAPTPELGRIAEVLASAGLFRQGAVLVGTAAYQCYSPLVGVVLPAASMMTQDVDLATASLALSAIGAEQALTSADADVRSPQNVPGDSLETILRRADQTFAPVAGLDPQAPPSRFRASSGFLVDVLVPIRHRDDKDPMPIPALRAGGTPLQHLDWLIHEPSPAVALHGSGVLLHVPRPARYAVHKLVIAQKRQSGSAKRQKDLAQAKSLFEALRATEPYSLEDELDDARSKGAEGWGKRINRSLREIGLPDLVNG